MYPEYAEIKGKRYKLNTSTSIALKCFEIVNDTEIGDTERALAIVFLIFGFIPDDDIQEFIDKASYFLSCGNTDEQTTNEEKDFDFNYDSGFVMASFMSDYHLDISKNDIHFWQYIDLIKGLTNDCVLSRVRDIRTYKLSDIKDPEERRRMAKMQAELALPETYTPEEQAAIDEFDRMFLDE